MKRIDLEETLRRANLANPDFNKEAEILELYYKGKQSLVSARPC